MVIIGKHGIRLASNFNFQSRTSVNGVQVKSRQQAKEHVLLLSTILSYLCRLIIYLMTEIPSALN